MGLHVGLLDVYLVDFRQLAALVLVCSLGLVVGQSVQFSIDLRPAPDRDQEDRLDHFLPLLCIFIYDCVVDCVDCVTLVIVTGNVFERLIAPARHGAIQCYSYSLHSLCKVAKCLPDEKSDLENCTMPRYW